MIKLEVYRYGSTVVEQEFKNKDELYEYWHKEGYYGSWSDSQIAQSIYEDGELKDFDWENELGLYDDYLVKEGKNDGN
jgi:hypothetical protein